MNILTDLEHLKNLLKSLNIKPKEYMGQNFLVSQDVITKILDLAEIKKNETVVEIGPGLGVLTQELAKKAGKLVAIEKDKRFAGLLQKFFRDNRNVEIVEQDVLRFNFSNLIGNYKIVANIPYYLTSHLLQTLLTQKNKPDRIVLMMQKEVGERLVADPGKLSVLGISVQIFADVSIGGLVPKENFYPLPKVDSCIVVIVPKNKFPEIKDQKLFFRILKIAFSGKRKQIHNTLANGLGLNREEIVALLKKIGVQPTARPQELSIKQWVKLYGCIISPPVL